MQLSLAQRIRQSNKPFVLFHTYDASKAALEQAISEKKSMDLDISVDDSGNPYLGHSLEFYKKSGGKQPENMPFWEAIELVSKANIPVIVDCKDNRAWNLAEEVVRKIGSHRCLVHIYASELKFDYNLYDHDYESEWIDIENLKKLKEEFPSVTTTTSAKYLPTDFLESGKYEEVLERIRAALKENNVDTLCLNVPDNTMSDKILNFFLEEDILPHINIDGVDTSRLTKLYVGETDILTSASACIELGY